MNFTDAEFLQQFENLTLPASEFDHNGHLRIAFIYLQRYELLTAVNKVCTGIKNYATSLGAADKFQHTLTEATVRIMAKRIQQQGAQSFAEFKADNADIVSNLSGVLRNYYHSQTLFSEIARIQYVEPDKQPIEVLCELQST